MGPTNFPANCNQNSCPLVPQHVSIETACYGIRLKLKYNTTDLFKLIVFFPRLLSNFLCTEASLGELWPTFMSESNSINVFYHALQYSHL